MKKFSFSGNIYLFIMHKYIPPGMVVHSNNPHTWEAQCLGQFGLCRDRMRMTKKVEGTVTSQPPKNSCWKQKSQISPGQGREHWWKLRNLVKYQEWSPLKGRALYMKQASLSYTIRPCLKYNRNTAAVNVTHVQTYIRESDRQTEAAGPKFVTLLPHPPECWAYRNVYHKQLYSY